MILRPLEDEEGAVVLVGGNGWMVGWGGCVYLSCPTVSPEPSSLLHPELLESSLSSQSWSSLAVMLTSSLNSLV